MDVVEFLRVRPGFFDIVNLKAHVGRYKAGLNGAKIISQYLKINQGSHPLIFRLRWKTINNLPAPKGSHPLLQYSISAAGHVCILGVCSPISMAQIPVPMCLIKFQQERKICMRRSSDLCLCLEYLAHPTSTAPGEACLQGEEESYDGRGPSGHSRPIPIFSPGFHKGYFLWETSYVVIGKKICCSGT